MACIVCAGSFDVNKPRRLKAKAKLSNAKALIYEARSLGASPRPKILALMSRQSLTSLASLQYNDSVYFAE